MFGILKKKNPMRTCLIYGNCQADALRTYLLKNKTFTAMYRMIDMKPVHLLSRGDIPYIDQEISDVDLLIYQPVSDNYKGIYQLSTRYLKERVKPDCRLISFPVAYFTGYNPEVTYLRDLNGGQVTKPFLYHDMNILKLFECGLCAIEILEIIMDNNFYTVSEAHAQFRDTLGRLKIREMATDIKLSTFIEDNFKNERLFHVFNHPNKTLLAFLTQQILEQLEISDRSINIGPNADILSKNSFPVYPSLVKHLGIQFPCEFKYKCENKVYSAEEIVTLFTEFYADNRELVRHNLERLGRPVIR